MLTLKIWSGLHTIHQVLSQPLHEDLNLISHFISQALESNENMCLILWQVVRWIFLVTLSLKQNRMKNFSQVRKWLMDDGEVGCLRVSIALIKDKALSIFSTHWIRENMIDQLSVQTIIQKYDHKNFLFQKMLWVHTMLCIHTDLLVMEKCLMRDGWINYDLILSKKH